MQFSLMSYSTNVALFMGVLGAVIITGGIVLAVVLPTRPPKNEGGDTGD